MDILPAVTTLAPAPLFSDTKPSKIDNWWRLCEAEVTRIDAWERAMNQDGEALHPYMRRRRQLFVELLEFLAEFERGHADHPSAHRNPVTQTKS